MTTSKNPSGYKKHRYKLADEPKKQPNIIFIHIELATKLIMDCTTTASQKIKQEYKIRIQKICHFDQRTTSTNKNKKFNM